MNKSLWCEFYSCLKRSEIDSENYTKNLKFNLFQIVVTSKPSVQNHQRQNRECDKLD